MEEGWDLGARMEGIEEKLREIASEADDDAALGLLEKAVEEVERMGTEMEEKTGHRGEAPGEERNP